MAGAEMAPAMRVRREIEFVMGVLLLDVARWLGFLIVMRGRKRADEPRLDLGASKALRGESF
jgi:hypothetical protein